jgi:hypothetical protein
MFASSSDILEMGARDLNGDGKAEILVRGLLHASAPNGDKIDREVLLVFQVANDNIRRVFAAEVARSSGRKRVASEVRFTGTAIELGPGVATEWTRASYPFTQDTAAVGGLEPLLLPWGGAQPARYRWTGSAFGR